MKNIHTMFNSNSKSKNDKWLNKEEGKEKPISTSATKSEAVKLGKEAAIENKSEHIIHNKDHSISEKK